MVPEWNYIKVGGVEYPAHVLGIYKDGQWDGRESRAVTLKMGIVEAMALLPTGVSWSIVVHDADGGAAYEEDQSEYCVAGLATDHRDGTVTVHMGKRTASDALAELEAAYDA